jgi:hypothetical protein
MFLKHMRFNDICEVLMNYANNFDLVPDKKFSGSDSIFMVAPKENK